MTFRVEVYYCGEWEETHSTRIATEEEAFKLARSAREGYNNPDVTTRVFEEDC